MLPTTGLREVTSGAFLACPIGHRSRLFTDLQNCGDVYLLHAANRQFRILLDRIVFEIFIAAVSVQQALPIRIALPWIRRREGPSWLSRE